MKNQLKGIALILFAVLVVVIGIAMTPDFSATFANITAISPKHLFKRMVVSKT